MNDKLNRVKELLHLSNREIRRQIKQEFGSGIANADIKRLRETDPLPNRYFLIYMVHVKLSDSYSEWHRVCDEISPKDDVEALAYLKNAHKNPQMKDAILIRGKEIVDLQSIQPPIDPKTLKHVMLSSVELELLKKKDV